MAFFKKAPLMPETVIFVGSEPDDATNLNLLQWFYNRVRAPPA